MKHPFATALGVFMAIIGVLLWVSTPLVYSINHPELSAVNVFSLLKPMLFGVILTCIGLMLIEHGSNG